MIVLLLKLSSVTKDDCSKDETKKGGQKASFFTLKTVSFNGASFSMVIGIALSFALYFYDTTSFESCATH
ncbi:MAG: hypothetical protein EX330_02700 [Candidatus Brocadia sp. BROELEC01]|nr:hypothetical protein [Candidatus Brocadia sapporoensis]QQR66657.1 MAG: hypothetical protein IPI25_14340 [Candidatus Brocadia sp.]RZV59378.1 MAG: hypothetical protein EX330_02700 [Candidatus Brocadia sp. BROELEC01]